MLILRFREHAQLTIIHLLLKKEIAVPVVRRIISCIPGKPLHHLLRCRAWMGKKSKNYNENILSLQGNFLISSVTFYQWIKK